MLTPFHFFFVMCPIVCVQLFLISVYWKMFKRAAIKSEIKAE